MVLEGLGLTNKKLLREEGRESMTASSKREGTSNHGSIEGAGGVRTDS